MSYKYTDFDAQLFNKTILVVDDDRELVSLISSYLENAGYNTHTAYSDKDVFRYLREYKPDLILLDNIMPGLKGYEISSILKSNNEYSNIPVIIFSANISDENIERSFDNYIYDFIQKPVNLKLLKNKIDKALNESREKMCLENNVIALKNVQRMMNAGYWEHSYDLNRTDISDELKVLLKNSLGVTFSSFKDILDHVKDETRLHVLEAIRLKKPFSIEHEIVNPNGKTRILSQTAIVDFGSKNIPSRLIVSVKDVTEDHQTRELVSSIAYTDALTHLPNRHRLQLSIQEEIQTAAESDHLLGVIYVGFDRFKMINDALGHVVGDELLVQFSNRLQIIDSEALYFRTMGDTFTILKHCKNVEELNRLAEEIISTNSKTYNIQNHEIHIQASCGISVFPFQSEDPAQLLKSAEAAMNYSKSTGVNNYIYYDYKLKNRITERFNLEKDLRTALDNNEFEVYLQPQVSVQNRRLIGAEALLRWNHPVHGIISPDKFIPIAEETGQIIEIGNWVIDQTARTLSRWKNNYGLIRIGVNLSPMHFNDPHIGKYLQDIIHSTDIPACMLDMEVTESSTMKDIKQTIKILTEFKEMGIQTSMDDFGTGYSSLSYLKKMPLHTLKIDREFIKDIGTNGENSELASMIIHMCHTLGLNVIAEGVEYEHHMKFLLNNNCIEAQGYLFSPPMPIYKLEQLLNNPSHSSSIEYSEPEKALLFA